MKFRKFNILLFLICWKSSVLYSQPASYVQEVFNASIPFNVTSPALRVSTADWSQNRISGTIGSPNNFQWVNAPSNPVASNSNITGFPAGAGFVRYLNRNLVYGSGTAGVNYAAIGDAAYLVSRSLDFSGHISFNSIQDTIGISIFRDNTAATLSVLDYVEVYLNTTPNLTGAVLLSTSGGNTRIHRSTTQAPVSTSGWNRYVFTIPNLPQFVSGSGGSSNVYVVVKAVSAGGNNIYFDNFNFPQWTTTMIIQSADLFYQEDADIAKGSNNNLLLGVKITTKGSSSPYRLDAATFLPMGSTDWNGDVLSSSTYFTGGTSYFETLNGAVVLPSLGSAGPGVNFLNFGYWVSGCTSTAPANVTLNPGSENYLWFSVNVSSGSTSGNYIGAALESVTFIRPSGTCNHWSGTLSSVAAAPNFLLQTFGKLRKIATSVQVPYYVYGASNNGYTTNDFISAIDIQGENGTALDNWYHDLIVGTPCSVNCDRFAAHPNSYTSFASSNAGFHKQRFVQIKKGQGVRTSSSPYILKVQCGTSSSSFVNCFIDWNGDGDFQDSYTGSGGTIREWLTSSGSNVHGVAFPGNSFGLPAANMVNPWSGTWAQWQINVPDPADVVTNVGGSGGQALSGYVLLRVREALAVSSIHPFLTYEFGETEDYYLNVLSDCPSLGTNICKWIGNSDDWNDNSNWCPAVPTINDVAYIPVINSPFVYPVINANTTAVCRSLKLMDNGSGIGAKLLINAAQNGILRVADDVSIGHGAPSSGSTSNIEVKSINTNSQTIPSKSSLPPNGFAFIPQTPFRTNAQQKTQIAYTATELTNVYGWKAGDVIDQISIEVNSITGGAGPSSFQNFRIQAYLTSSPVSFPFPAPANTKIAIAAGDANVIAGWPKIIYSNPILSLNMPQGILGTQAVGNYYTFTLVPNTFIWDGVSNVVLEFCTWSTTTAPLKSYVLYDEPNTYYSVLSINGSLISVGGPITGFTLDGAGHYSSGVSATISASVSNYRPRLDFTIHSPYSKALITVGGNWINNNKNMLFSSVAGSDGFRAGYSKVVFDPVASLRTSVNSPGLITTNTWNPFSQSANLLPDIDQEITSMNNASTVFNQLEINKISATGKVVKQNSTTASLIGAYADSLALINGEFNLNRKEFTLINPAGNYLARTNGWIKSEDNAGVRAGIIESKFTWRIGIDLSSHSIPFGINSTTIFPFLYTGTSGDIGTLTVGTYGTAADNTTFPFPNLSIGNPLHIDTLYSFPSPVPPYTYNCAPWVVDRFWMVKSSFYSVRSGLMRFEYPATEGTLQANYVAGEMKAQRHELSGATPQWHSPYAGQTDGINGLNRYLQHNSAYIDPTYCIWAIIHTTATQPVLYEDYWAPALPVKLLLFTASPTSAKEVLCQWTTASEINNDFFSLERSKDGLNFELVEIIDGAGNSTINLNYSFIDKQPLSGISYYRLKQTDYDGSYSYSQIVAVKLIKGAGVLVYPNPSSGLCHVTFSGIHGRYRAEISDLLGNIVTVNEGISDGNLGEIQIDLSNSPKAFYQLKFSSSDFFETKKIVVQ